MFNKITLNSLLNKSFSVQTYHYHLKCCIVVLLVFIISLIITPFYIAGDQSMYIRVYNELPLLSFSEGHAYYKKFLTSSEIMHFLLTSIFSRITEKFVFVSIFNSILAYVTLLLFRQWKVNFFVSSTIVLTNYYMYILFFPAERLKFGIIFLLFSLLYINERKKFIASSILSFISHFQIAILYASILIEFVLSKVQLLFFEKKLSKTLILIGLLAIFGFVIFQNHILFKFKVYLSLSGGVQELWKALIFFIGAMIYSNDKKQTVLLFIPLLVATYLLGGGRVNMLSFFVFLYFALPVNQGFNFGILLTSIYFGYKNILFLNKVILYGNGFY